jgi:hypothetical protein
MRHEGDLGASGRAPAEQRLHRLLGEALRLARHELPEALKAVSSDAPEVTRLLADAADASTHSRTRTLCRGMLSKHDRLAGHVSVASAAVAELRERHPRYAYAVKLQALQALTSQVDARKLADAELLAQCTRARESVDDAARAWAVPIVSAHLLVFSEVGFHRDLVSAFLGRPTTSRRMLETAAALAEAVATDLAGQMLPFLGTIQTVLQIMTPWSEREAERMRQATGQLDRLFQFDDQLTEMLDYGSFVESGIQLADQTLTTLLSAFTSDADWLIDVLQNV